MLENASLMRLLAQIAVTFVAFFVISIKLLQLAVGYGALVAVVGLVGTIGAMFSGGK